MQRPRPTVVGTNAGLERTLRPLRTLLIGVAGGGGVAIVVAGVVAVCVWFAVTTGVIEPVAGPRPRIPQLIIACALAGALPGVLAARIHTPGFAALLGAATAIAATGMHRLLDPGAYDPLAASAAPAVGQLLMPGLVGLAAPLVWAPVRAAAARNAGRAVVEISARVGALVLGFFSALIAAPAVFFGGAGLLVGLLRLSADTILFSLGPATAALTLVVVSCLCFWLAGVPRGSGPLPGFEPRPPAQPE